MGDETFDKYDHHKYGLIQISKGVYQACPDDCCKWGGK